MDESRFQAAIRMRDEQRPSDAYEELRSMFESADDAVTRSSLLLNMAACQAWMGHLDEADALIREARSLFPAGGRTPRLYADFLEASVLASSRRYSEAVSAFEKLLAAYSDLLSTENEHDLYVDAKQRLGFALVAAKNFGDGISVLEELVCEDAAEQQRISLYLGIAYSFAPGQSDRARSHFLAASGGTDTELRVEADCRLGILELQSGRHDEASNWLTRAYREASSGSEWRQKALEYMQQLPVKTRKS